VPLIAGVRLGAYEIIRLIDAGGMGEVYEARDTRLDRIVAVKVLPDALAHDPERRARLEREARAVATLNHPHICALYDVGEAERPEGVQGPNARYLVMEYLQGQTLVDRLLAGPLSTPELLRYAIEIADALDHAHRRGVVHRDLKPANVMLTATGAKVLDFGVSKVTRRTGVAALATVEVDARPLTAEGTVLGTFPYMAPEQLEGREADARTDVFAFGATVYEMATGRRAFDAATPATLIASILHTHPPPVSELRPQVPPVLDHLVSRCLARDPDDRWQSTRDLVLELRSIAAQDVPAVVPGGRWTRIGAAAMGALALLAIVVALAFTVDEPRPAPAEDSMVRLAFEAPDDVTLADLVVGGPVTISPDGQHLAFAATGRDGRQQLWVRPIASSAAQALPGSDGGAHPFWSPDGQSLGFFAQRRLKRIRLAGGPPQTLCDAVLPRGGTWNTDGVILFSAGAGRQLYRVPADGGVAAPLPNDGVNQERHWPSFLPDGEHFVYFGRPRPYGVYLAALDAPQAKLLRRDAVGVAFAPPGHLLLLLGSSRVGPAGTLMAHPFDVERLETTGEPVPVAERIRYESGLARGAFTVSANGTLVYEAVGGTSMQLTWVDRGGSHSRTVAGAFGEPALSPDEQAAAVELVDPVTLDQDIWLVDLTRNVASRFTSHPNDITLMPVWSPDGTRIVFASTRDSPPNLFAKPSSGTGAAERLLKSTSNHQPTDWSRDGRHIVYAGLDVATQWDLWLLPMSDAGIERQPVPLLQTEFNEHLGRVSPDGRWYAYTSDESGANEVYVRTFPGSGAKKRITVGGGSEPKWRDDGRELFYRAPDGTLMAADVRAGVSFDVGSVTPLFRIRPGSTRNFGYDVTYAASRDGQRFLVSGATGESDAVPRITVVLNWAGAQAR
jgi:serine/threonine protein kinase/Tol biopolymer transport system component